MTERQLVAGVLAGTLRLRDVKHIDERTFEDWTLANIFCIAVGCLERGAAPRTDRIVKVLSWFPSVDTNGLAELIDQLRSEGDGGACRG